MPALDQDRKTVRFPLIGEIFHRPNLLQRNNGDYMDDTIDQRFINCMFRSSQNPLTGDKKIWVFKRTGIGDATDYASVTSSTNYAYTVVGQISWALFQSSSNTNQVKLFQDLTLKQTVTVTGNVAASRFTYFVNGGTHYLAFWVQASTPANNKAFIYNITTDTLTEITDADFPKTTLCGNFVYKDGFLFIMEYLGAKIYNSDLNSFTSWDSTAFISPTQNGLGRGLSRHKQYIVAFGQTYTEFFENVGNPNGSPLQRVDALRNDGVGLFTIFESASATSPAAYIYTPGYCYIEAFDTVFFLGASSSQTGVGLYTIQENKIVLISSPSFNMMLSNGAYDRINLLSIAGAVTIHGLRHIFIVPGSPQSSNDLNNILVLNLDLNVWSTWQLSTPVTWSQFVQISDLYYPFYIKVIYGTKAHTMDLLSGAVYTDVGANYTMTIQTSRVDLGTENRKRLHKLKLIGSDSQAVTTTGISWSDDDYQTFNTPRNVDLNNARTYLDNGGMFRRRAFRITNSTATRWEAEALEFDVSVMQS